MKFEFEHRYLQRNGKCICCGKEIKANQEKIFNFKPHKSQVYRVTMCDDCVKTMSQFIESTRKKSRIRPS